MWDTLSIIELREHHCRMATDPVRAALANWAELHLVGRASVGYSNEVWFATLRNEECVVRVGRRSAAALEWELQVLALVAELGLAVPDILPTLDGRRSVDSVVVFRRITGEPPTTTSDWQGVREYLMLLHARLTEVAQRPGFRSAVDLLDADSGGLVDLAQLPEEVTQRCRAAWSRLRHLPTTVVHGDPGAENIFIRQGQVVLIDWDEARVDSALFDIAALPDAACPLGVDERWVARQAASAWEAAISWHSDREYAMSRLGEVELL